MVTFLTITYVFICLFLILVVLIQPGKGGGMGATFGGATTQSVFGGAGAGNFLTRLTVICAMLFMILSATLAYISSSSDKSLERVSETVKTLEEARKAESNNKKEEPLKEPAAMSLPEDGDSSESSSSPPDKSKQPDQVKDETQEESDPKSKLNENPDNASP